MRHGVQHGALLQREMRFTALAVINTASLLIGTAIAIGGAKAGYGYWALVAMTIAIPLMQPPLVAGSPQLGFRGCRTGGREFVR